MAHHNAEDDESSECSYEPEYEPETISLYSEGETYEFTMMTVVPPPIEYMAALHTQHQEISGRQVWCGSLLLCHYILKEQGQQQNLFGGKRVLELGSGAGIVGMLVSRLNHHHDPPSCVAMTDGDDRALDLLLENLQMEVNHCPDRSLVQATTLRWGEKEQFRKFDGWCCQMWPKQFTFEDKHVEFEVILAGDVLYKSELPSLFFQTVQKYLSSSAEAFMLLCHVPRSTVDQETVIRAAQTAGFDIESMSIDLSDIPPECPMEDASRARIYKITRPS